MSDNMELHSVACGNCGAGLSIPETARFVTCNHCGSSLEIKQTENVSYSERIAQIDERTGNLESKLEALRLENELLSLEQSWERTRKQFEVTTQRGNKYLPTRNGAIAVACISGLLGTILLVGGSVTRGGFGAFVVGSAIIVMGAIFAMRDSIKADDFAVAERRCRNNRQELSDRLAALREPGEIPEWMKPIESNPSGGIVR